MIFNNNYDRVLSLMLCGDNDNNARIVDFLTSIPNNFLRDIQDVIRRYNECDKNNIKENSFNCEIYDGKDSLYYFSLDTVNGGLVIGRSVYKHGVYFRDFEMKLNSYYNVMNNSVGEISYDYEQNQRDELFVMSNYTNVKYNLLRMPFGCMLKIVNEDKLFGTKIRMINSDNLSNNCNLDKDRLIRKKKRV